jgi:hypothetical protein
MKWWLIATWIGWSAIAHAQASDEGLALPDVRVHGFVSEGGFLSTDNDYIGKSSRGTLEFFEAAINAQTDLSDKLHVGLQLFSQDEGAQNDSTPRLDWGFLDYHWRRELGIRAGRVRIPFGLYNEYIDIDSSRVPILLPQSVYPLTERTVLNSQTGFLVYGDLPLCHFGSLEYQAYGGELSTPLAPGQDANSSRLYQIDSKYIYGGQLFWHPPVDGLRVGAGLDEYINLAPALTQLFIMEGVVPPTFDGNVIGSIRPANFWIASAEYMVDDWQFAAEYSRWFERARFDPVVLPAATSDNERFYGLAAYHINDELAASAYYSVLYTDVNDRSGSNKMAFPSKYDAWSRDAAATLRWDVNDHWLWKAEAHFIDGAAYVSATQPMPARYWGMFLVRTTVTF